MSKGRRVEEERSVGGRRGGPALRVDQREEEEEEQEKEKSV